MVKLLKSGEGAGILWLGGVLARMAVPQKMVMFEVAI